MPRRMPSPLAPATSATVVLPGPVPPGWVERHSGLTRVEAAAFAVVVALSLLPACAGLFPWHEPAVRVYISPAVLQCPAADSVCAALTELPGDTELLAQASGDAIIQRARLTRATGMQWTEPPVHDGALHLRLPAPPEDQARSVYVLEVVRAETAHDSLLSIASNGGTIVWLNGELLGASRSPRRPARARQDLYPATLRQGTNVLLYRVLVHDADAQLHREWHPRTSLPDLLAASIDLGAYAALVRAPLLPDSSTSIHLLPPQIHLRDGPVVHFRWRTLLGDSLGDAGRYVGGLPEALPLPAGFQGLAVLQTDVRDAAGRRLYFEECPIFADSTAARLAHTLAADTTAADPVRAARVSAVRAVFSLGPEPRGADPGDWLRAQVLASLYRHVRQPAAFHRYAGPQVWGYRAADGSVQPYWLTVPPAAREPAGSPVAPPGLILSVNHFSNPDFWAGRGRVGGFVVSLATMASSYGTFGVLPHLGGLHDFDTVAVKELPAITRQVASVFAVDTTAVGMLVWSNHAREALQMASDPDLSVAWLGLAVPAMYRDQRDLTRALDTLYRVRPRLHWLVWQAKEDTVVLQERTERWVGLVRQKGFDVRYRLVPYSTHLGGYFENVEADLHRSVAFRFRGAAGRALRDSLAGAAPDRP